MRALEHTTRKIVGKRRHISGQELLAGVVELARLEFGDLAWVVFGEWGITKSEDFGAIVYALGRPDLVPAVFGYHELFHVLTVLAAGCQFAAIALLVA